MANPGGVGVSVTPEDAEWDKALLRSISEDAEYDDMEYKLFNWRGIYQMTWTGGGNTDQR